MTKETSVDAYVKELSLNIRANHPISVVYTDDLNDTLALTKQAMSLIREKTDKIYYWSPRNRWTDISDKNKSLAELLANPVIVELKDKQNKTPMEFCFSAPEQLKGAKNPVFIMSLVSAQAETKNIGLLQELRDFDYLVRNGVNDSYRLIILANNTFEIPVDYENIFGVIRHKCPEQSELEALFDTAFMKEYIQKVLVPRLAGEEKDAKEIEEKFKALKNYCVNTLAGLSGRQFKIILYKAVGASVSKASGQLITGVDFEKFKTFIYDRKFSEISKSEVLELLKPLPMSSVGGLDNLKSWLEERAWSFTPEAKKLGVERSKGMALIGPPGTGKTHVAKATASILEFPCLKFNAGNIFSKWVGDSEQRMKQVLETVEATAPCVLFVDEVDKVFASQAGGNSAGDSGTSSRVFGQLLSWMQDTKAEVFVIVTANRIQNIPSEFLRKGRLDEIWCVTFPTRAERSQILNIHLKQRGYTLKNVDKVLDETDQFSSSELEYLVKEGILKAGRAGVKLTEDHLLSEIKNIVPSAIAFKDDIERMKAWAMTHARMASLSEVSKVVSKKGTGAEV